MTSDKIVYDKVVVDLVIDVYGSNSVIFQALVKGEDITNLVKESIKKKGKSYRIRDKKQLLKLCSKEETVLEI